MKKICLIAVIFSFISVTPSFGLKLITNNQYDRTVPSRSSGAEYTEYTDNYENNGNYKDYHWYQGSMFDAVYKPILSPNIRRELIGTTWYYPDYNKIQNPDTKQENQETDINSKNYIREAADYYYVDTNINPDKNVPIGY